MQPLPIDAAIPGILAAAAGGAVVVRSAAGSGKTTRVPPALLASGLLPADHRVVLVLEPRRVAARAAAARIAAERGWTVGGEVGYQVRFDSKFSAHTRLRFLTEGVLARRLIADPFLESVGAVVIDEFHERSLHADLALALLNEIRRDARPDLVLVVMSATLEAEPVARYLGDCAVVDVPGALYPVEIAYRATARRELEPAIAAAVSERLADPGDRGHILVFLPGMAEIRRAARVLEPLAGGAGAVVLPLHGSMPAEDQDRVLAAAGPRKIILATNVAETSLTIEGVTTVVDSGLERLVRHDPERGVDRHQTAAISRASASQRAGRAGRTGPGRCIRLYADRDFQGRPEFGIPEIHRVDLAATVLSILSFGVKDLGRFPWFDPPARERVQAALRLLGMLGAVAGDPPRITAIGEEILALPLHPRLGRLMIEARRAGRLWEGASLAALLSEADPRSRGPGARPSGGPDDRGLGGRDRSDVLDRLEMIEIAESARFSPGLLARGIDAGAARQVARARDDLLKRLGARNAGRHHGDEQELLEWLLVAYPDRLVKKRGVRGTGLMVGGRGARLARGSSVRDAELFLAIDAREIKGKGGLEILVEIASPVQFEWLERRAPGLLTRETFATYDPARGRVVGVGRLLFIDLVLREDSSAPVDPTLAGSVLFEALKGEAQALARSNPRAAAWIDRVEFLRTAVPELNWPVLDESVFVEALARICAGESRRAAVEQADWGVVLESRLDHAQRRELAASAPESLVLPNGRTIRLAYEGGRPPILPARVQELFGWADGPRVARGRVPIVIHLLAPNGRPVQITADLRGFWGNTYHQVRKDLRGRYPKHAWPEDPLHEPPMKPRAKR